MNSTTYLTLDLQAPNLAVVASAKQNDTRGRQIAATLRDGSASFDATGLLCEIRYAKPDGTYGFYDTLEDNTTPAYSIDDNVVTFTLAEQMLTVAGAVYVDVNFYAATGEKLTAFAFVLQVEASVLEDGTIVSSDYYNVLTATLAQAAEIAANLPVPYTGLPENLGTPSSGAAVGFSRGDHVHAMPSAADVGALTSADVNYTIYDSVTDLGLTSGSATIGGAWSAMVAPSILICPASDFSDAPNANGTVEIVKASKGYIQFWGNAESNNDYRMFLNASDNPSGTWVEQLTRNSIVTEAKSFGSASVAGGESNEFTVSVAKTGYTPLGFLSVTGLGTTPFRVTDYYVDGTTAHIWAVNTASDTRSVTWNPTILYIKN